MRPQREFAPGLRRRPAAGALSFLVHALVAVALVQFARREPEGPASPRLIVLEEALPVQHDIGYRERRGSPAREIQTPSLAVAPRVIPSREGGPLGPALLGGRRPGGGGGVVVLQLAPRYVSGQLWVPPLPLTTEEIASRLGYFAALAELAKGEGVGDGEGDGVGGVLHAARVDSAVTAIVQSYLDSVAGEPSADLQELPAWVAEVGGLEFGVDQQWIYFAGLRIPAAVLALLPLPGTDGNYFQDRQWDYMMEIRREIYYAAWMADTREAFKENVRKLRERTDRERAFARSQRIAPVLIEDTTTSASEEAGQ